MTGFTNDVEARRPLPSRRTFLRGGAAALGGVAGGALLAACGGSQEAASSSAGGSAGEKADVVFLAILPMTSLTFTPEYVADLGGHFEKQNLNVTFQTTHGSAPAIQTILADKALITRVGDNETMIAAAKRNAPVLNVGVIQRKAPMRIVSSSKKPLRTPKDLAGKKIGLPSAGGTSEITLDLVLSKAGIPESSITKQVIGGFSASSFSIVESGRLDGYVVSSDLSIELKQQRPDVVVLDLGKTLSSGSQLYMTSKPTAEKSPDLIRRYMRATRDAVDFVIKDADNDFAETLKMLGSSKYQLPTLKNPEVAKGSLRGYVESWTLDGPENVLKTVPARWEAAYKELVEAGMVPGGKQPDQWYTNDYWPSGG